MRLKGKVTVITGAGSGIGLSIAKRFVGEGAKVVAGDWNAARLDEAVENITRSGGTIKGPMATSPIGGLARAVDSPQDGAGSEAAGC